MIEITVDETRIRVEGHAGFGPPGRDIVCAGVSALFQTLVWSIEDVEFAAHSIDEPVSKQEAKTVLMYMARYFDSSNGVNWAYIEEMIRLVKHDGGQPDKQLMKNRDSVPVLYHDFCDDEDKMRDFPNMTKQDFLALYDYLTEEEYDMTVEKLKQQQK